MTDLFSIPINSIPINKNNNKDNHMTLNVATIKTMLTLTVLACSLTTLMGCQSRPAASHGSALTPIIGTTASGNVAGADTATFTTTTNPDEMSPTTVLLLPSRMPSFNIQGKIGAIIPATETQSRTSGTAFYAWAQDQDRFAMELMGALGIGRTVITYDGQMATLSSERTGTLSASNPEQLLTQATGWQAPISQLPYWISGSPAPSDSMDMVDNYQRLIQAVNADWNATFSYEDDVRASVPNKIKILREDGHSLVMTVEHNMPTLPNQLMPDVPIQNEQVIIEPAPIMTDVSNLQNQQLPDVVITNVTIDTGIEEGATNSEYILTPLDPDVNPLDIANTADEYVDVISIIESPTE